MNATCTKLAITSMLLCFGSAHAEYQHNFKTPSGNIICGGDGKNDDGKNWNGVSCFIQDFGGKPARPHPKDCEFDWGGQFELSHKGRTEMGCYSDYPYNPNPITLHYGESISGKGWKCTSLTTGLRCENRSGHGFELNRNKQILF